MMAVMQMKLRSEIYVDDVNDVCDVDDAGVDDVFDVCEFDVYWVMQRM